MGAPFHDDDSLDIAEQLLMQTLVIIEQLQTIVRTHREKAPRIAVHDGSLPVSPLDTCADEPPSRDVA